MQNCVAKVVYEKFILLMLPSGSSHAFLKAIPFEYGLEWNPFLGAGVASARLASGR